MKTNVKKFASILLAVAMMFSMFAVISVSAAETGDSVGANLNITGTSNYCTSDPVSVAKGSISTLTFKAPAAFSAVSVQWGMNYDSTKLQLMSTTSFAGRDMLVNRAATSYNVMGSVSNDDTPYSVSAGDTFVSFTFRALTDGESEVTLTVIDLMNRTDNGDVVSVENGVVKNTTSKDLTVNATSNFFAAESQTFNNVTGDTFVAVSYKMRATDKYIINVDVDELTYDPAVLEWSAEYNTSGSTVNFFPFAVEQGTGSGTVYKTADGRVVGNYSSVSPAAKGTNEGGQSVTVVKAVFKVVDPDAGSTTVKCDIDTMALCDLTVTQPYMQSFAIDGKTVNASVKAQATYETAVEIVTPEVSSVLIGDVDNNGKVEINDATALQQYLGEFTSDLNLNDALTLKRCDANKDGKVDVRDVTAIQRHVAGLEIIK